MGSTPIARLSHAFESVHSSDVAPQARRRIARLSLLAFLSFATLPCYAQDKPEALPEQEAAQSVYEALSRELDEEDRTKHKEGLKRLREMLSYTAKQYEKKKIRVSRKQRKRLERVKKSRRKRVLSYWRQRKKERKIDPRGEPEVRFCSLQFGMYGTKAEIKNAMRAKEKGRGGSKKKKKKRTKPKGLAGKERSFIDAVVEAKCDVVAFQGLVGRKLEQRKEAAERFVKKLNKKTEAKWRPIVGKSNHKIYANGFFVNEDRVKFITAESHDDKLFPRFDKFQFNKFTRAPMEILIEVPGQGGAPKKQFLLMTMDLQRGSSRRAEDNELYSMQAAESLRQLVRVRLWTGSFIEAPTFVLLGDRAGMGTMPTSFVLEGSLRLPDFKEDGTCFAGKVEDEEDEEVMYFSFSCEERLRHPRSLLRLLGSIYPRPPVIITRKDEDGKPEQVLTVAGAKERRRRREEAFAYTSDIYLLPEDAALARKYAQLPGPNAVGTVEVKNDLPGSPLIWAELNW